MALFRLLKRVVFPSLFMAMIGAYLGCFDGVLSEPKEPLGKKKEAYSLDKWTKSAIKNVVILVQENHSFDGYFGDWCTGAPKNTASENTGCHSGWGCCETAFTSVGSWKAYRQSGCTVNRHNDADNLANDPYHDANHEVDRMNRTNPTGTSPNFMMNDYPCSSTTTMGTLPWSTSLDTYFRFAEKGALADRYFQPIAGATSSNMMFFARAGFVFQDNQAGPKNAVGNVCYNKYQSNSGDYFRSRQYRDRTIGDLLTAQNVPWYVYIDGYNTAKMKQDRGYCYIPGQLQSSSYPDEWDPSDNPFNYYPNSNPASHAKDLEDFFADIDSGFLPSVSFIRMRGVNSEHPGVANMSDGMYQARRVYFKLFGGVGPTGVVHTKSSIYGNTTLLLVTNDEGGGQYDHVAPPNLFATGHVLPKAKAGANIAQHWDNTWLPNSSDDPECYRCVADSPADGQQYYGTRVPLIALGPFSRKYCADTNAWKGCVGGGYISHTVMEHSSIVKFIEWNWLGSSGQLTTRDRYVNNIGSMLDANMTGMTVPSGYSD